jgi:hypothetical protein
MRGLGQNGLLAALELKAGSTWFITLWTAAPCSRRLPYTMWLQHDSVASVTIDLQQHATECRWQPSRLLGVVA